MYVGAVLFGLLGLCAFIFYRQRRRKLLLFKNMGIDGPTPDMIYGNNVELRQNPAGCSEQVSVWSKKFGRFYGYFEGTASPTLVSTDLDFLHKVFVKEFSRFSARKIFSIGNAPDDESVNIVLAEGFRWKRLRNVMSPAFTTNKMKNVTPLIQICIDDMLRVLEEKEKKGNPINIYRVFQGLTMSVIATAAFGAQINAQTDDKDPFLVACKNYFDRLHASKMPWLFFFMMRMAVALPEFKQILGRIFINPIRDHYLEESTLQVKLEQIIKERKQNPIDRSDFLNVILAAETDENIDLQKERELYLNEALKEDSGASSTSVLGTFAGPEGNVFSKKLTVREIECNSRVFLNTGYETTSNALACAAYELVRHPQVQSNLQNEIDKYMEYKEILDYDDLRKMSYLDNVFNEVLRLHPIAPSAVSRRCLKDTMINGILVKEGVVVQADVLSIHRDPEVWGPSDVSVFDPDRFLTDRHPMAFLTFGAGPRNCVGARFAILEGKLALVHLLRNYSLEKCPETEIPMKTIEGATVSPANGVIVRLIRRSK